MKSKGFSPIEIVLVVAVVLFLGFVGWRVWEAKKDKGNADQNTQQNQQSNESKGEEYVTITEWGVRFKPVEGLTGVEYGKESNFIDGYVFTTAELVGLNQNCSINSENFSGLGVLERVKQLPDRQEYESIVKQIGEYSYLYWGPQAICAGNSERFFDIKKLLKESLSNLEQTQ